jgi:hypothetical protein
MRLSGWKRKGYGMAGLWRARAKGAGMDHLWHIVMAARGAGAVLALALGFALRGEVTPEPRRLAAPTRRRERANRNRKSPCWLRTVYSVGPCVPKCSLPARDPHTVFGLMHGLRMVQRACRVTTIRLSISNFDRSQTDCCRIDGCCVGLITSQAEVGAR